jgi:hypothetical protein
MLARTYKPDDILPMVEFLPEHLRDMVAHLFSSPQRGSSYLLQLSDPEFELLPKYIPEPLHIIQLKDVFEKLYPGFDIASGRYSEFHTAYTVEHVTTRYYE